MSYKVGEKYARKPVLFYKNFMQMGSNEYSERKKETTYKNKVVQLGVQAK